MSLQKLPTFQSGSEMDDPCDSDPGFIHKSSSFRNSSNVFVISASLPSSLIVSNRQQNC